VGVASRATNTNSNISCGIWTEQLRLWSVFTCYIDLWALAV
jgi:hypothetical protein